MTQKRIMPAFEKAVVAAYAAESKKADDIRILEINPVSCLADYFVICTAETPAQIKAIQDAVAEAMKKLGDPVSSYTRDAGNRWSLIDAGDVVVHIFHTQERHYYQLDEFWSHAQEIHRDAWDVADRQAS